MIRIKEVSSKFWYPMDMGKYSYFPSLKAQGLNRYSKDLKAWVVVKRKGNSASTTEIYETLEIISQKWENLSYMVVRVSGKVKRRKRKVQGSSSINGSAS